MAIHDVARQIHEARQVLVFTGAGISTESGIPDFRSPGGIWSQTQPVYYDEFLASEQARYEYWRQKAVAHRSFADAQPNVGHRLLAEWETAGWISAVVTQNIDGLHQAAGSRRVLELHGTARKILCLDCQARFDAEPLVAEFLATDAVPACPTCPNGRLKHATISFGQALDEEVMDQAYALATQVDLVLALGSSLVVYPAASIPQLARQSGAGLIIINRDPTPLDALADHVLQAPLGATLQAIHEALVRLHEA